MKNKLSLVFTAAGMSKRMGTQKQLMRACDGRTLAEISLSNYLKLPFFEIKIITGSSHFEVERILSKFSDNRIEFVFNPDYENGLGTSVATGVRSISNNSDGCMISLADMPYIKPTDLQKLIYVWESDIQKIVAPLFKGRRGNPVIFPSSCFCELSKLSKDRGGSSVIKNRSDLLVLSEMIDDSFLRDVDTLSEWEKLNDYLGACPPCEPSL